MLGEAPTGDKGIQKENSLEAEGEAQGSLQRFEMNGK